MWWIPGLLILTVLMAIAAGVSDSKRNKSSSTEGEDPRPIPAKRWRRLVASSSTGRSFINRTVRLSEEDVERINDALERDSWTTKPPKRSRRSTS